MSESEGKFPLQVITAEEYFRVLNMWRFRYPLPTQSSSNYAYVLIQKHQIHPDSTDKAYLDIVTQFQEQEGAFTLTTVASPSGITHSYSVNNQSYLRGRTHCAPIDIARTLDPQTDVIDVLCMGLDKDDRYSWISCADVPSTGNHSAGVMIYHMQVHSCMAKELLGISDFAQNKIIKAVWMPDFIPEKHYKKLDV